MESRTPDAGPEAEGADPYACPRRSPGYELSKRAIDVAVSALTLGLLSPAWLAIGIAIRSTSDGPALFSGPVVGRRGRVFTYYKFRTMVRGDDTHHREWLADFVTQDAAYRGGRFKVDDDPRVTRVGRWLRRTSLDEIPQLINVLRGEMSLIGPRPPIPYEFDLYDRRARGRLAVKPGITGLYQVTARSQVPFTGRLALDREYIERRSLRLDLWIMWRTIAVMLSGRGAA